MMTKTPTSFDAHNLKTAAGAVLGSLLWYSIPDLRITPTELDRLGTIYGIRDLPKLGAAGDAFRRATQMSSRRGENRAKRYLIRPVKNRGDELVRHLVVERCNPQGETLEHESLTEFRFDSKAKTMQTNNLRTSFLAPDEKAEMDAIMVEVSGTFDRFSKSLTGREVSRWLGHRLDAMSRVTVHPHGHVYFIPDAADSQEFLGLRNFIESLDSYQESKDASPPRLWVVAVPDTLGQRRMVEEGFTASMTSELQSVVVEVAEMLASTDRPTPAQVESKSRAVLEARHKAETYKRLLGISAADLEGTMFMLDEQLWTLSGRAFPK